MSKLTRRCTLIALIVGAIAGVWLMGCFLTRDDCPDRIVWLSWKDNTVPGCQEFEIREEGEYLWFGTIKAEYDLPVRADDWICVRVDADNNAYNWEVMVYWDKTMAHFGLSMRMRNGETQCRKANPGYYYGERIDKSVVYKAHWCGFGKGGVVARPVLTTERKDLTTRK